MYAHAGTDAYVTLTPENPLPNSTVTLTLTSLSFDVHTALISWEVNGKVVRKGDGETSITIKTGSVGDSSSVTITAETKEGGLIKQSVDITPSSVSLMYEAPASYVPPFYEGRSLPSDGSLVRVSAIPSMSDGNGRVDPASLSYVWYLNDSVIKSLSGRGKQSADIRLDYLRNENEVRVVVRTPYGNVATKTITITPHAIMPLVYLYDDVLGANFSMRVGKRFETTKDFILSLHPFYMPKKGSRDSVYTWLLDGLQITPTDDTTLALHPKKDSYGVKNLTVRVEGPNRFNETVEQNIEIIFDTRK